MAFQFTLSPRLQPSPCAAASVAVRKPEVERVQAQIGEYGFAGRVQVVEGGDNRQESVAHALAALPAEADDIVLVHDAVRPLIDAATIERTIDAVAQNGAAIVGLPAVDTIKQVERTAHGALITSTIPREFVVLAQTPQGFRFGLLQRAFAEATQDGFVGTDEASVVERAGHPVAVVHGSQVNLKITQPGDLELAEFYLRQRALTELAESRATRRSAIRRRLDFWDRHGDHGNTDRIWLGLARIQAGRAAAHWRHDAGSPRGPGRPLRRRRAAARHYRRPAGRRGCRRHRQLLSARRSALERRRLRHLPQPGARGAAARRLSAS